MEERPDLYPNGSKSIGLNLIEIEHPEEKLIATSILTIPFNLAQSKTAYHKEDTRNDGTKITTCNLPRFGYNLRNGLA